MQVQTKADQQNQCSNVHGIANVLVRTCLHKLFWRVKGSGTSSPARNEYCSTGERKQPSHRHENNSEGFRPGGQQRSKAWIERAGTQGNPPPEENEASHVDKCSSSDKK